MTTVQIAWTRGLGIGPTDEAEEWRAVDGRPSGVSGLYVTPAVERDGWTLTHKMTGRCVGYRFPTIAAARRAATAIADFYDWTDPEICFDMVKPSHAGRLKRLRQALSVEGERY